MYEFTRDGAIQYQENKCPVCGGEAFEWGQVQGSYKPNTPSANSGSALSKQVLKARRCVRCNNVLQFTDPQASVQRSTRTILIVTVAIMIAVVVVVVLLL